MVADMVRNVGGDLVEVVQLMGEGVDPHLYKASPGDIRALNKAELIFYSGLHLEGKMADVFVRMARTKPTYAVTERIGEERILETGDQQFDPHVWFDVGLWSSTADVVAKALGEYDPTHAKEYEAAAQRHRDELKQLDEEVRQLIAEIPAEQRVLVTAHDAFHYFGRAYDIEVRAIQGISTEDEASVREINELIEFIGQRQIKAVFVETSISERNVRSLIEGCQSAGHEVIVGGELYSDAMGDPATPEGTYIGMVRHNAQTIVNALK
jgi:manganese/zinc/iron transport system substrate-binding protein